MVIISKVVVPFLVIVVCYSYMYLIAQSHIKKISKDKKNVKCNKAHFSACRERNEFRGNITIMIVIGVFVTCWLPSCFTNFCKKRVPNVFPNHLDESRVSSMLLLR